jgi:hypothetical protein
MLKILDEHLTKCNLKVIWLITKFSGFGHTVADTLGTGNQVLENALNYKLSVLNYFLQI